MFVVDAEGEFSHQDLAIFWLFNQGNSLLPTCMKVPAKILALHSLSVYFLLLALGLTNTLGVDGMRLHSVISNNPHVSSGTCPVVFLHGLDSSSQTWSEVMPKVKAPCLAIDLRGCGDSSPETLHDDEFSMDVLVQDIFDTLEDHPLVKGKKFILCGHSMGGRIAISYAASHPTQIATLIVEDMDTAPRTTQPFQLTYDPPFERSFESAELATDTFVHMGYPLNRVEKWVKEGRIAENSTKKNDSSTPEWWSHVNPDFRRLCYKKIMALSRAQEDWRKLSTETFPTYLLVAGPGQTVCLEESLKEMQEVYPSAVMHRYPTATHSIHNSNRDEFIELLNRILSH